MRNKQMVLRVLPIMASALFLVGCDTAPPAQVSYAQQVQPILAENCLECHDAGGTGAVASGLNLASYDGLMKGTKFGPVIKSGDSLSSTLVILVEGRADAAINMPHGNRPSLTTAQIQNLRQWIDQGANNN
jgi:mono/diheme cytochrome c family protein